LVVLLLAVQVTAWWPFSWFYSSDPSEVVESSLQEVDLAEVARLKQEEILDAEDHKLFLEKLRQYPLQKLEEGQEVKVKIVTLAEYARLKEEQAADEEDDAIFQEKLRQNPPVKLKEGEEVTYVIVPHEEFLEDEALRNWMRLNPPLKLEPGQKVNYVIVDPPKNDIEKDPNDEDKKPKTPIIVTDDDEDKKPKTPIIVIDDDDDKKPKTPIIVINDGDDDKKPKKTGSYAVYWWGAGAVAFVLILLGAVLRIRCLSSKIDNETLSEEGEEEPLV